MQMCIRGGQLGHSFICLHVNWCLVECGWDRTLHGWNSGFGILTCRCVLRGECWYSTFHSPSCRCILRRGQLGLLLSIPGCKCILRGGQHPLYTFGYTCVLGKDSNPDQWLQYHRMKNASSIFFTATVLVLINLSFTKMWLNKHGFSLAKTGV